MTGSVVFQGATVMMIAAGGEILKIHMHTDLFCMEPSLLSYVCAESSTLGKKKEVVGRKEEVILELQKHTGLYVLQYRAGKFHALSFP